jgi:prolyl-tRNA synthetase
MLQSELFSKTLREAPKDEVSRNAVLLTRAGFVDKVMAGVYTYLPAGLKVLNKIKDIIREEMNNLGAQEVLMPALTPKENWEQTGRWNEIDVLFKLEGAGGKEYALGSTHEEIITPLVKKFASSHKDLPVYVYQIQDKYRNEPRAKSGLLRGREFSMKDLYSFHKDLADLDDYYDRVKKAYLNIFKRCGLRAEVVEASGGVFSKFSHEFQVVTPYGEDNIILCDSCDFAQNTEICDLKNGEACPNCSGNLRLEKAIEVGNIFKLKTKFSQAFDYKFTDEGGKLQPVLMGCYGLGPSRVMGAVAEIHNDPKGIIWPAEISPFQAHLLILDHKQDKTAAELYRQLTKAGFDVLMDDREESAGVKLNDADLMGISRQLILGGKTKRGEVEYKYRDGSAQGVIKLKKVSQLFK